MDTDPELILSSRRIPPGSAGRRGIAMVTAIFALVIVGVLVAGMYNLAALQAKATKNRTASTRALLLAESAAAHAVMLARDTLKLKSNSTLLRGFDLTTNSADDGLLTGYGMSSGVQIPSTGYATTGGRYWVTFRDDDAETDGDPFRDSNMRIIAQCRAATADSAYATIDVLISGISQMPGFFSNGNLSIGGQTQTLGACGTAHANGNLTIGNPGPTMTGLATATGSVSNGGVVKLPSGGANPAIGSQAPLDVPPLPYGNFCPAQADYVLKANGTIENHTVSPAALITVANVTRTATSPAVIWSATGSGIALIPGVICVEGNFALSGNAGSALAPISLMIVATHSVSISGNPYLRPATTDSILIVAGADLAAAGNPASGAVSYEGLMYAGSQCAITGSAVVRGNFVCRNDAHTTAAVDYATGNSMAGSAQIEYGCGGYFNQPRRILQWVQLVQ